MTLHAKSTALLPILVVAGLCHCALITEFEGFQEQAPDGGAHDAGDGGAAGLDGGDDASDSSGESDAGSGGGSGASGTGGTAGTAGSGGECQIPSGQACATFPLCGCPPAQNCMILNSTNELGCGYAGSKGRHETCNSGNECAIGFACINGICVQYCNLGTDCEGVGTYSCAQLMAGIAACMFNCDVQDPNACEPGLACGFFTGAETYTLCRVAGAGIGVGACSGSPYACAPGYHCSPTGDCRQYCRVGVAQECPTGKNCEPFNDHPTVGGYEYGSCVL